MPVKDYRCISCSEMDLNARVTNSDVWKNRWIPILHQLMVRVVKVKFKQVQKMITPFPW